MIYFVGFIATAALSIGLAAYLWRLGRWPFEEGRDHYSGRSTRDSFSIFSWVMGTMFAAVIWPVTVIAVPVAVIGWWLGGRKHDA